MVRDRGQTDVGEVPDGPAAADISQPDKFTVFTDSTSKADKPKTVDQGKKVDQSTTAPANDTCANAETLTWTGAPITRTVDTTNAKDDIDLDPSGCTGDSTAGNDVFFKITLPAGKYNLKLTGAGDGALYVLSSCSVSACVAGSDEINAGVDENIALTVTASTTYYVGVDSYDPGEAGSYTLTITSAGSAPDGGPKVDGPKPDAKKVEAGPTPDGPVGAAKIVITEIMADPSKVGDEFGEWFEVYNAGSAIVNLKGWKIAQTPTSTDAHVIASDVPMQPGQYIVLGNNSTVATNGGVTTVAYQYPWTTGGGSGNLANSSDTIYLYDDKANLIDNVSWSSTTAGASRSLKNPTLDNSVSANWCTETTAWGTATDKGTPGAAAGCQ